MRTPARFAPGLPVVGLLLAFGVLAGCGFELRGQATLPPAMATTRIEAPGDSRELVTHLGRLLAGNGVRLAEEAPGEAAARLVVESERLDRQVQSVGATARVREFALHYAVAFRVEGPAGEVLLPRRELTIVRDFTFDQNQVLGTTAEEALLARELRREMAQRMLAVLSAG